MSSYYSMVSYCFYSLLSFIIVDRLQWRSTITRLQRLIYLKYLMTNKMTSMIGYNFPTRCRCLIPIQQQWFLFARRSWCLTITLLVTLMIDLCSNTSEFDLLNLKASQFFVLSKLKSYEKVTIYFGFDAHYLIISSLSCLGIFCLCCSNLILQEGFLLQL